MRKAAGILMILYSAKTIGFLVISLIDLGFVYFPLWMYLVWIILAVFIITGGFFCLKKKYWKICFASSLVLLLFMIFELLFGFIILNGYSRFGSIFTEYVDMPLSIPWGILPEIFVCLRRSEWQAQELQG